MPEARPSEEIGLRKLPFAVAPAVPDVRLGGLAPWRISRLQAFVEEHLSQSIHIADLSGAVGLSVPHFARAFGRSFGEPPHLYVIQRRLDRARRLMLTSDMALSELAVACGFNDQAHFCRLFRRHTGRTPAAWRREWRDAIRTDGSSSPLPRIAAVVADQGVESRRSAAA
jgi:AraC family transcriptional regulator